MTVDKFVDCVKSKTNGHRYGCGAGGAGSDICSGWGYGGCDGGGYCTGCGYGASSGLIFGRFDGGGDGSGYGSGNCTGGH